jgi:hypothetical protein
MGKATKFIADGMNAVSIPRDLLKTINKVTPYNMSPLR